MVCSKSGLDTRDDPERKPRFGRASLIDKQQASADMKDHLPGERCLIKNDAVVIGHTSYFAKSKLPTPARNKAITCECYASDSLNRPHSQESTRRLMQ